LALVNQIWLVAREMGGWAEAGGVKDVVRGQAEGFVELGWSVHVILPLYGFLRDRLKETGELTWTGASLHPTRPVPLGCWTIREGGVDLHFLDSPSYEDKLSVYTYSALEEKPDQRKVRGEGYQDGYLMNLEFQWACVSYWAGAGIAPGLVLGHDGHCGFLAALVRGPGVPQDSFRHTQFFLLIHNAGPGYRQEMSVGPVHQELLGLPADVLTAVTLDGFYDPLVCAGMYGQLGTVSENYADELLTGRNDGWSGTFGPWLRATKTALKGITNGILTSDKDPRDPEAAGLPAGFDPDQEEWRGKSLCRRFLQESLLLRPLSVYGRMVRWNLALYVMQGRLTAQKGVDALIELVSRALREEPRASFVVMAQGDRGSEERLIQLARTTIETGRFLFINKFEEALSQLVFASGDFFLMPSEYEPCGLTDFKAQLMGTLPIVHRVGGLVKVLDGVTGFSYTRHERGGFWGAFKRSLELWEHDPVQISAMRKRAFRRVMDDFNWTRILENQYVPWLTQALQTSIL
jgi:starch synthase